MQVNGVTVADRHNRPGVQSAVGLRVFFINDGVYQDPYEISGVTIFSASANMSPSSILNAENLIASDAATSAIIKMHFAPTGASVLTTDNSFLESNYAQATTASAIYKLGTGEYVVILDGTLNLSGVWNFHGNNQVIANTASGAQNYLDVWTIRSSAGSKLKSVISNFTLYDSTYFVVTQPLLLTPKSRLITKKINFGSKVDLEIENKITIGNRDIDESIKNIFRDSVVTSAAMEIVKLNDEPGLASRVTVSSWTDTSALMDVTSDNTLVLNWDTNDLKTHASTLAGTMGSLIGNYTVQAKFNLLNETYFTDRFYFIVE